MHITACRAYRIALLLALFVSALSAQAPARKKLLVIGEEKGYRHEAVSHAMATIERLGKETGLWDTVIRTDTEALTKKKLEYNAKNLNDFDAVLFYTGGTLEMDDQQKADFLSFIHDDGKGFIGIHSATITFTKWPEYGEMIGGYFDEHPWSTFEAPDHRGRSGVSRHEAVAIGVHADRRDLPDERLFARRTRAY